MGLIRAGTTGAILAAICCATPLLAVSLPLASLGAWFARPGLTVTSLLAASIGLVMWGRYRRRAEATRCDPDIHKEGEKP